MSDVLLGETPTVDYRDAIHVAVIPMVADVMLRPGQRVGVLNGRAGPGWKEIGIVDPFLTDVVPREGKFWLCLFPGSVEGMRHHWQHSAFPEPEGVPEVRSGNKGSSEHWIRTYLDGADIRITYEELLELVENGKLGEFDKSGYWCGFCIDGEYLHASGMDAHGPIRSELWDHLEIVTGKKMENRPHSFSCSC